jgi:hypothetical protein
MLRIKYLNIYKCTRRITKYSWPQS